ncbi:hypothetical protein [Streptomyces sp. NPDC048106]|uniref:hypothetical protein n=1 Tax=Streptomyces sp. NPDC048106 TaxID=3155750 RepID=UPI003453A04A
MSEAAEAAPQITACAAGDHITQGEEPVQDAVPQHDGLVERSPKRKKVLRHQDSDDVLAALAATGFLGTAVPVVVQRGDQDRHLRQHTHRGGAHPGTRHADALGDLQQRHTP